MKQVSLILLLLEESNYLPASYFAEKLSVSNKTVYQYLSQISKLLEERKLRISKIPRKGLLLEGNAEAKSSLRISLLEKSKLSVSAYGLEYRRLYLFSRLIFDRELKSYQRYAEDFYVSVQSIKKDFDVIIEFLKDNKISVKRERHDLILNSDEWEIEQVFKKYLESYQENHLLCREQEEELFGKEVLEIVRVFVKNISVQSTHQPNDYLLESLSNSFFIVLNRLKGENHFSEKENLLFNRLEVMQFYTIVLEFTNQVTYHLKISFSNSDISYLCSLLFAHAMEYIEEDFENSGEIRREVKQFISEMSRLINCDLTEDNHLYQSLLTHIMPMIYRAHVGVRIKNPLQKEIINQYTTMYTLVAYGIKHLAEHFSITINKDELTFITIHFQLAFEKVIRVKHLLIVCPSGLGTSQLVLQKIKQSLPEKDIIEIIDFKKLGQVDLSKVDLLISTVNLGGISLPAHIPLVYVSSLPTVKEISLINKKVQNMESHEKTFTFQTGQNKNLIKDFLDKELIFIGSDIKTVSQALDFLSLQLEKRKIVTVDFREAIYRREAMGTTALSTGVAIPHADPATVLKTKLEIVTLKTPILWGKTLVGLIILVAISEADTDKAKDIIASIYECLTTSNQVAEIAKCQSKQEIIGKMMKISEKGEIENDKLF